MASARANRGKGISWENPIPEPPEVIDKNWLSLELPKSRQALGGHQNSHRRDWDEGRMDPSVDENMAELKRNTTVLSPEPVTVVFPFDVQENLPGKLPRYIPCNDKLPGVRMDQGGLRYYREQNAVNFLEPTSACSGATFSTGDEMDEELDLELKL